MSYKTGIYIFLMMLFITTASAEMKQSAKPKDPLRGAPFSDPAKIFQMPDSWVKQPIKYEQWAEGADLAVALDQQLYPAILPLIRQYEKQNNLKIAVVEGTCGTVAGAAMRKNADITGMCCPPGDNDRLPNLKYHTLGISSVALLVNKDNPVDNISIDDARKVFMGKLHKWSDTKGAGAIKTDMPIKPVVRLHCKTRPGHWCLLLANEDLFGHRLTEIGTIADMLATVASLKGAVGYETLWHMENLKYADKVKPLKIEGIDPADNDKLARGMYTIYRTFSITTWEQPGLSKPQANKLVQHILQNLNAIDKSYYLAPVDQLKKYGWKFQENELVGEP
ncbi:MAG: substrate-binding domain-containing protein [Nitrospirae bacterium]|uniref:substrate-binding domain-containing protein n=1 Tax=Candidatus Magnetobacterium casense TaxID=1455061 RepID=UPI00058E374C|nr:substrate-binding domain-containing protein [Candidatus Magnetobacterium casensis]MBF0336614.1 substrate-binding domain-containing protein [Nitrospirota bacterium]